MPMLNFAEGALQGENTLFLAAMPNVVLYRFCRATKKAADRSLRGEFLMCRTP